MVAMHKVLYIEDESDMVEVLPILLRERGLDLKATQSLEEGSRWFKDEVFDAVLLDICMPPASDMEPNSVHHGRETGVEVARRFHRERPEVPIIALTVVYDEEIKARMREAGIREIINKPIDPSPIADTLLKHLRR